MFEAIPEGTTWSLNREIFPQSEPYFSSLPLQHTEEGMAMVLQAITTYIGTRLVPEELLQLAREQYPEQAVHVPTMVMMWRLSQHKHDGHMCVPVGKAATTTYKVLNLGRKGSTRKVIQVHQVVALIHHNWFTPQELGEAGPSAPALTRVVHHTCNHPWCMTHVERVTQSVNQKRRVKKKKKE